MEELTAIMKNLQRKFDEQTLEIRDMKQSIPQIINNNIDKKFELLEHKYINLEKSVEEQGRRIQHLERKLRQKNLIFFGIEEKESNNYQLQNIILDVVNQKMKIKYSADNIDMVQRLGKQSTEKIRPVIVTFTIMRLKYELLRNKKSLTDTPYYIKEDLPPEVLEIRKKLNIQLRREKQRKKSFFEIRSNHYYSRQPSRK